MTTIKYLGGPGTGKTYQLVQTVKALQTNIAPSEMIVCTFRKNAAEDLINELELDKEETRYMGTIHSVCYRILGYPDLIESKDLEMFCCLTGLTPPKSFNFSWVDTDNEPKGKQADFFNLYGWMKNTLTPIDKISLYPQIKHIKIPFELIKSLIIKYEDYKKEIGKIDFTDMISGVFENQLTPIGAKALIVDEFQDLTPAQFEVFRIWATAVDVVVIAGDPNQTIYPFWGATSQYFKEYEGEEKILPVTYRVPIPVWNTAKHLLKSNRVSVPDVVSDKPGTLDNINYKQAEQIISKYDKDTFHLVRSNYQGVPIAYQLAEAGIIYIGNINPWTDNELILLNAIIKLRNTDILTKKELLSILSSFPDKYFKFKTTKKALIESIEDDTKLLYSPPEQRRIFHTQQTIDASLTFYDVIKSLDPTAYMIRIGKLQKLKISKALQRYNHRVKIDFHTVRIDTIHGSKGLEADTVFLHTGTTPKIKKSMQTLHGRQDEARVFFVGMTRAAQTLFVVKDKGNNNYKILVVMV